MVKSINVLNKKIRYILKNICRSNSELVIKSHDKDVLFALHECIQRDFLENIREWKNANGEYRFNKMGEIRVTGKGLIFLKETAFINIILQGVFKIFRGFLGFLLGIISSLIIAYLTWKFGWLS